MPPPYKQPHWERFTSTPYRSAGAVGIAPSKWATRHELLNLPVGSMGLPTTLLDRNEVRRLCRTSGDQVLFGYICVMAWGGQGAGPDRGRNARIAWEQQTQIETTLKKIKSGGLSRKQAYELFQGTGEIQGLGPSYWTKLLYFLAGNPLFMLWISGPQKALTSLLVGGSSTLSVVAQ